MNKEKLSINKAGYEIDLCIQLLMLAFIVGSVLFSQHYHQDTQFIKSLKTIILTISSMMFGAISSQNLRIWTKIKANNQQTSGEQK